MLDKNDKIRTHPLRYPVVDLHSHLRNCVGPEVVRDLATKNSVFDLPHDQMGDKTYTFQGFQGMLDLHEKLRPVFCTPEDFEIITESYLKFLHHKGCVYAELSASFSPQSLAQDGSSDDDLYIRQMTALSRGIDKARAKYGIEARILINFVRHHPVENAMKQAKLAAKYPFPYVTGVGLSGDETRFDPTPFKEAFRVAYEEAGLWGGNVHAGEVKGPESVWAALEMPGLKRLGHGVRASEDPELMSVLADRGIICEICPSINVLLGVYDKYDQVPIDTFLKNKVKFVLGSDNAPYFKTSISREYRRVAVTFGLSLTDMLNVTRTGIESAFLCRANASQAEKAEANVLRQKLLGIVDEYKNLPDFSQRAEIFENQKNNRMLVVNHDGEGHASITWQLLDPIEELHFDKSLQELWGDYDVAEDA